MSDPVLNSLRDKVNSKTLGGSRKDIGPWKKWGRNTVAGLVITAATVLTCYFSSKKGIEKVDNIAQENMKEGIILGRDVNAPIVASMKGNLEAITFQQSQEDSIRTLNYNIQTSQDSSSLSKINPALIDSAETKAKKSATDTSKVAIAESRADTYAEILGNAKLQREQRNTNIANTNAQRQRGIGETVGYLKRAKLENPEWYFYDKINGNEVEFRMFSIVYDKDRNVKGFIQEKKIVPLEGSDFIFTESLESLARKNTEKRDSIISVIKRANDIDSWIYMFENGEEFDAGLIATGKEIKSTGYKFASMINPEKLEDDTIYLFRINNGIIGGTRTLGKEATYIPESPETPTPKKKLKIKNWNEKYKDF